MTEVFPDAVNCSTLECDDLSNILCMMPWSVKPSIKNSTLEFIFHKETSLNLIKIKTKNAKTILILNPNDPSDTLNKANTTESDAPHKHTLIFDPIKSKTVKMKFEKTNADGPMEVIRLRFYSNREESKEQKNKDKEKWAIFKDQIVEFLGNIGFVEWDFCNKMPDVGKGSFLLDSFQSSLVDLVLSDEQIQCFKYCVEKEYKKIQFSNQTRIVINDDVKNEPIDIDESPPRAEMSNSAQKTKYKIDEHVTNRTFGIDNSHTRPGTSVNSSNFRQSPPLKKVKLEYEYPDFMEELNDGSTCNRCNKIFKADYLEDHLNHCGISGFSSSEKKENDRRDLANRKYRERRRVQNPHAHKRYVTARRVDATTEVIHTYNYSQ